MFVKRRNDVSNIRYEVLLSVLINEVSLKHHPTKHSERCLIKTLLEKKPLHRLNMCLLKQQQELILIARKHTGGKNSAFKHKYK